MGKHDPNSRQVGGTHYQGEYQHWDLVLDTGMGYLEGCATKYLSRWKRKGGVQDLEKAKHYVEKLLVHATNTELQCDFIGDVVELVDRFCDGIPELTPLERTTIQLVACWVEPDQLRLAIKGIDMLIVTQTTMEEIGEMWKRKKGRTAHPAPFGYNEELEGG